MSRPPRRGIRGYAHARLNELASPEAREADFAELFRDVVRALRKSGLVQ